MVSIKGEGIGIYRRLSTYELIQCYFFYLHLSRLVDGHAILTSKSFKSFERWKNRGEFRKITEPSRTSTVSFT